MNKYDSTEFALPPGSLDAAYEREAILSGLMGRGSASFPENRPDQQTRPLYSGEVRGDRRNRGLEVGLQASQRG